MPLRTSTMLGLPTTRLPAGDARARLFDLARRGVAICSPIQTRGARLVTHLCSNLHLALMDLASTEERLARSERALGAAKLRIGELQRALRQRPFEEQTVEREAEELRGERRTAVRGAVG